MTASRGQRFGATLASKPIARKLPESPPESSRTVTVLGWIGRLACLALVSLFAWFRGGVDYRMQFWMGLLVMMGLVAWSLEYLLDRKNSVRGLPLVAVPVILGIVLGLIQLIPLPNFIADVIAPHQRELIESFASPAGIADSPATPPTRISLDVTGGRAQLSLLSFALGGLILGAHFFRTSVHAACFFIVVSVSAAGISLIGILQRVVYSGNTILPNEPVSGVLPFAFFVNRNNAACFLLIGLAAAVGLLYWNLFREIPGRKPRLIISREIPAWRQLQQGVAIFFAELTLPRIACLFLVGVIALGVVATLSRGGVLALLVGGVLTTMLFGVARDSETRVGWAAFATVGVIGLALWLGFGAQLASRFDELNNPNSIHTTDRVRHWSSTLPAVLEFGCMGSGLGSYHAVHRLYRQDAEERLFQHADNQYFESLVETGWIGLLLIVAAIALVVWSVLFISKKGASARTMAIGVAGLFLISSVGIASVTDFGVQIPANCLALAVFVGIVTQHSTAFAGRLKREFRHRKELPKLLSVGLTFLSLVGVGLATWHIDTLAKMERLGALLPLGEDNLELTREQTDRQLTELEPLAIASPTYWGYRRMGELHLHRYRLSQFEQLREQLPDSPANLWQSTNLVSMHEQMYRFKRMEDQRLIDAYAASAAAKEDIVPAWKWLIASRNLLPFQADVQLMLGQMQAIFGDASKSFVCFDRSSRTSPSNADFAYVIGLMHMHADRIEAATVPWRTCVTLQPRYFDQIMARIHPPETERWKIEPEVVFHSILPADPRLLLAFCSNHLQKEKYASLRQTCLERADQLLSDRTGVNSDPKVVALEIQIKLGLGQNQAALDKMKWLIQLRPSNMRIVDLRFEMAQLMFAMGQFAEAYDEIKWLRENDFAHIKRYSGLYEKLRLRLANPADEP